MLWANVLCQKGAGAVSMRVGSLCMCVVMPDGRKPLAIRWRGCY